MTVFLSDDQMQLVCKHEGTVFKIISFKLDDPALGENRLEDICITNIGSAEENVNID